MKDGVKEYFSNLERGLLNAKAANKKLRNENDLLIKTNKFYQNEIIRLNKIMPDLSQKMCGNKKAYPTKKSAEKTGEHFEQRVYECPVCFCFHLTSKKTLEERAKEST